MKKLVFFIVAFLCAGTGNTLVAGSPKIPAKASYSFTSLRSLYQAARGILLDEVGENAPLLARLDSTYAWLHDFLPIPKSYRSEHKAFDALLKIARTELSPETSHALTVLQRAGKKKLGFTVGAKVGIGVAVWVAATVVAIASLLYFLNKIRAAAPPPQWNAAPPPQMRGLPELPDIFSAVVSNNVKDLASVLAQEITNNLPRIGPAVSMTRQEDPEKKAEEAGEIKKKLENALEAQLNSNSQPKISWPNIWAALSFGSPPVFFALPQGLVAVEKASGMTPLHMAAWGGHIKTMEALLKLNASVNVVDCFQATPLYLAAAKGHLEAVKMLLAYGASLDAKDDNGKTPLQRAKECNHTEVVEYLEGFGMR
ncbi:MAG: ankyrin repeat domain-containing protein [bacterium]